MTGTLFCALFFGNVGQPFEWTGQSGVFMDYAIARAKFREVAVPPAGILQMRCRAVEVAE